ncbi:UDP-glucose:undecaprenyl-phosphate glucose-1-phosphate transferase [Thiorhodovibrio winogradskyi]|uniref:UDP-glucose:undecaprenyl-phosphate glucose-1-phosphate transferase n=1 Tax=Thiorhodovibrio winogradskyi TaxID=77007 RepID=A0ABZ0SCA5_9GAMM|nr:TIGR03013 family XrtA/PEP-CTERM system glycosyltransferase [Thiorhodovibrio winogradskyi]
MQSIRIFGHFLRLPLILLALLEGIVFALSFFAAAQIRYQLITDSAPFGSGEFAVYMLLVGVVFVLAMASVGLYEASLREGLTGSIIRIALALFLGTLAIGAITFAVPHIEVWRSVLAGTAVLSFLAATLLRLVLYRLEPSIFQRRILIVGDTSVVNFVLAEKARDLLIAGIVPLTEESWENGHGIPKLPHDAPLVHIATSAGVNEILLAIKDRRGALPMEELLDCRMSGIPVLEPQDFVERELGMVKLDYLTPSWLVRASGFDQGTMTLLLKRLFDLAAAAGLFVLSSPIMALAALAIAMEDGFRHPVLYRQVRIGKDGHPFKVTKFRSMRVDAEADGKARWATKNDPRITRVGSFLRKTRIDELPQLVSVLKGEMSFVGPRPERPEFVGHLAVKHPYYAARLRVKPGLTGWAQLKYPYGSTEEDALRKLEYDLYYVKNHSTFLDVLILLQTVEVVLFGKGAL